VLVASIAVAVVGTLALLLALPGRSPGAPGAALSEAGDIADAGVPAAQPEAEPSSWPAPKAPPATSLRPAGRSGADLSSAGTPAAVPNSTAPAPRTAAGPRSVPLVDRTSGRPAVFGWLENRSAPDCPRRWTARVHVMVVGTDATQVLATWFDGEDVQTVSLRRRDRDWVGEFDRVPVGKQLWWRAGASFADGSTASTRQQPLGYSCAD
jgi:hypothetical protein